MVKVKINTAYNVFKIDSMHCFLIYKRYFPFLERKLIMIFVYINTFRAPRNMCVFDIHVVDKDRATYDGIHPQKILFQHKRHKKGKYLEACLDR